MSVPSSKRLSYILIEEPGFTDKSRFYMVPEGLTVNGSTYHPGHPKADISVGPRGGVHECFSGGSILEFHFFTRYGEHHIDRLSNQAQTVICPLADGSYQKWSSTVLDPAPGFEIHTSEGSKVGTIEEADEEVEEEPDLTAVATTTKGDEGTSKRPGRASGASGYKTPGWTR